MHCVCFLKQCEIKVTGSRRHSLNTFKFHFFPCDPLFWFFQKKLGVPLHLEITFKLLFLKCKQSMLLFFHSTFPHMILRTPSLLGNNPGVKVHYLVSPEPRRLQEARRIKSTPSETKGTRTNFVQLPAAEYGNIEPDRVA